MHDYLQKKYNHTRYLPVAYLQDELQLNYLQFEVLKQKIFEELRSKDKIVDFDHFVKIVDEYLDENRCQGM